MLREWCTSDRILANDVSPFVGWSKIPEFPGNENVPPPFEMTEAARQGLYRAKCLPETLDIIARARRMRKNHPFLRTVYILADEVTPWAEEVKIWLLTEGWEKVWIGQRDIWPTWQEREIGVGVDMEVARRSGVFVGNGVSRCLACALVDADPRSSPPLVQTSLFSVRGMGYILISRSSGRGWDHFRILMHRAFGAFDGYATIR